MLSTNVKTKMSRKVHLQQHLLDLRERERLAKLHNRELLQQFDEAQKTLREMLDLTSAMKMLRKEYESYFWRYSHPDCRLHLKRQTTLENMPGGPQMTLQKNSEISSKSNHNTSLSQGLEMMPTTTEAYQGVAFPPELPDSRQTLAQTQTAVHPKKASVQPEDFSQSSPFLFPHSYLIGSHALPFTQAPQPYASLQTSPFADHPDPPFLNQCLSDQPDTHDSNAESQRESVSKRSPSSTNGENSHSEDLDVKPVRLSCHLAEQKGSQTSSQWSTPKKKDNKNSSNESQQSNLKLSKLKADVTGLKAMALTSSDNSETSSHQTSKHSKQGFKGKKYKLTDGLSDKKDETDTEDCNSTNMSGSTQQLQNSAKTLKSTANSAETKQNISDQSCLEDDSEKEKTRNENEEKCDTDIPRCSSEEEDYETEGSEDYQENADSVSDCESAEENIVSDKDNGQNTTKAQDSDSEECIVSPQTRSKTIYVIPEHVSEHESSRKTASSDDDQEPSGLSDIEHVLAPQEKYTERQQLKLEESKSFDLVARFYVEEDQNENDQNHSDSNKKDDFYDL